jgi:eukaryotic-like serine/threonine-protein kinase
VADLNERPHECSRCRRGLPLSDEPVSFCPYCGWQLRPSNDIPTTAAVTFNTKSGYTSTKSDPIPDQVGGYRLKQLLGVGGMGRVFEAESQDSGRRVAVKLLSPHLADNPTSLERFKQEGRLASQIVHPFCVFVFEADSDRNQPFIVMELMPGTTLKDLVDEKGPLPYEEAIRFILNVIDGLQEAHRLGVLHRDVKPSNCFLTTDGRVKIGDFGLSKSLEAEHSLTRTGAFLGTVLYASPEQVRGEVIDYSSDVYSVCATLFHLLTGRAPFHHENATAVLAKVISEDAPNARTLNPAVPIPLARILEKGLERDRNRRFSNLEELRSALIALIPDHLTVGGLGIRFGAYILDQLIMLLLIITPLALILKRFDIRIWNSFSISLLTILYFTISEGRLGASIGKWFLGLRVVRNGKAEPPGIGRALVRSFVFVLLLHGLIFQAHAVEQTQLGVMVGYHLQGMGPFLLGSILLWIPMRRRNDFRGLHEMISGSCVMRVPRRNQLMQLQPIRPGPLDRLRQLPESWPKQIGPYPVLGLIHEAKDRCWLLGEDQGLGRRVLILIQPDADVAKIIQRRELNRPSRLRWLMSGTIRIDEKDFNWQTFLAPNGAPLESIVSPKRTLGWVEARNILEQLTNEMVECQKDGTTPESLTVSQVWLQPDGRVYLMDEPLEEDGASLQPKEFIWSVMVLGLEGKSRSEPSAESWIAAPIPLHAQQLLSQSRILATDSLTELQTRLTASRQEPARINQAMRLFQLVMQSGFLSIGILTMFVVSGLFSIIAVTQFELMMVEQQVLLQELDQGTLEQTLGELDSVRFRIVREMIPKLNREMIQRQLEQDEKMFHEFEGQMSKLERWIRKHVSAMDEDVLSDQVVRVNYLIAGIRRLQKIEGVEPEELLRDNWNDVIIVILFFPVTWSIGAALFRGGPSFWIAGIVFVRPDGQRAKRSKLGLRVLIQWLPIATLLSISVLLQVYHPGNPSWHLTCWWLAGLLLLGQLLQVIAFPQQSPLDRMLNLKMVPR